jgi:hypothetical protein
MAKKFHVETQRPDGTWQTFTVEPVEGEEAAQALMGRMIEGLADTVRLWPDLPKLDPSKVRLHELTEEDLVREVVKKLTPEEKEHIVLAHVRRIGTQAYEKHFDDQVEALAKSWELPHQPWDAMPHRGPPAFLPMPKLLAKFDPDLPPDHETNQRAARANGLWYDNAHGVYRDSDGCPTLDKFGQRLG